MNEQIMAALQQAGGVAPQVSLEEKIGELEKLRKNLERFRYGSVYAHDDTAFGMHSLAQLVELGALEVHRDEIRLAPIGVHEMHRLGHVINTLGLQLKAQRDEAAAAAEREAELNAPHPDFAPAAEVVEYGDEEDPAADPDEPGHDDDVSSPPFVPEPDPVDRA